MQRYEKNRNDSEGMFDLCSFLTLFHFRHITSYNISGGSYNMPPGISIFRDVELPLWRFWYIIVEGPNKV